MNSKQPQNKLSLTSGHNEQCPCELDVLPWSCDLVAPAAWLQLHSTSEPDACSENWGLVFSGPRCPNCFCEKSSSNDVKSRILHHHGRLWPAKNHEVLVLHFFFQHTNKERGRQDLTSHNVNWTPPSFFNAVRLCETWVKPRQKAIFKLIQGNFESLLLETDTHGYLHEMKYSKEDLMHRLREQTLSVGMAEEPILGWTGGACCVRLLRLKMSAGAEANANNASLFISLQVRTRDSRREAY